MTIGLTVLVDFRRVTLKFSSKPGHFVLDSAHLLLESIFHTGEFVVHHVVVALLDVDLLLPVTTHFFTFRTGEA